MPVYEFIARETGEKVMLRKPVDKRDELVIIKGQIFDRVEVPSRVTVLQGHQPPGAMRDIVNGYYKEEQKLGSRFRSEFTPDQIKQAWSTKEDE
jgi:hypothetical protein